MRVGKSLKSHLTGFYGTLKNLDLMFWTSVSQSVAL